MLIRNKVFKTKKVEPLSTTALILEDRPRFFYLYFYVTFSQYAEFFSTQAFNVQL